MDMRGGYHRQRVQELVDRFKIWREERVPGVRAFQSMYDRYMRDTTTLCNKTDVFNQGWNNRVQMAVSIVA
jgi:hypothetical protein